MVEKTNADQVQNIEHSFESPLTTEKKVNWMKVLLVIGIVSLFSGVSFYLGRGDAGTSLTSPDNTSESSPTPVTKDTQGDAALADLSFAYVDDTLYMKYKDKVYTKNDSYDPKIVSTPINVTWNTLPVERPIPDDESGYNGLFDFKSFSKGKFVFITKWEGDSYVYYYDGSGQSSSMKSVASFAENKVPKVNLSSTAISKDYRYIVMDIFECWWCGGHAPETVIVELSTGKIQNIGKISAFEWLEGSKYQYKVAKLIPCAPNVPQDQCYPSYEKPESLPYTQGNFE